jgi:hypothetical protein
MIHILKPQQHTNMADMLFLVLLLSLPKKKEKEKEKEIELKFSYIALEENQKLTLAVMSSVESSSS